jgi:hypothetical protein
MIPKSGTRLSDQIMLEQWSMIPKSGNRFSEWIMLEQQPAKVTNATIRRADSTPDFTAPVLRNVSHLT